MNTGSRSAPVAVSAEDGGCIARRAVSKVHDSFAAGASAASQAFPGGARGTAQAWRRIRLAVAVTVGAAALGVGGVVPTANAEPAPSHAGWDGSRYWFTNSAGEWRWTHHHDIYLRHTHRGDSSPDEGAGGIHAGWDGSRYWFTNSAGEWRWTHHHDIYLRHTHRGDSSQDQAPSGIHAGWDGSRYWFTNSAGEWRWTRHYDIYLRHTHRGDSSQDQAPGGTVAASPGIEAAVEFALAELGKPFETGGNGPDGYDCSGLVQQAFRHAGISLPRIANDQYDATTPISSGQLRRGDLLFWSYDGSPRRIHHVAIYLGDGRYVEAAHPGTHVRISTLGGYYWPTQFGRP